MTIVDTDKVNEKLVGHQR